MYPPDCCRAAYCAVRGEDVGECRTHRVAAADGKHTRRCASDVDLAVCGGCGVQQVHDVDVAVCGECGVQQVHDVDVAVILYSNDRTYY